MNVEGVSSTCGDACKTYKIRWFTLGIFVFYSASNSLQWIQYSIITNVIMKFYNVSSIAVDWTSMVYMILYIPFIFPASMLLDKFGIRKTIISGSVGTTIGTWIKVGSVRPDLFWVSFLGQSVVALSQVCILSVPARLAAAWFPPNQVSSACSIGVLGTQLGIGLGFLITPWVVSEGTVEEVTVRLYLLFIGTALYSTMTTMFVIILFKEKPPTPPSVAEALRKIDIDTNFKTSLKALALNKNFILLNLGYGINVGIFFAISTLLNQIILKYYPDNAVDAGQIGLLMVLAGMVGSVVCGVILDKTRKYKETTLAVHFLSSVTMVVFAFTLHTSILVVYIASSFLGFFMAGLLPVGFELGSELTYPEPEGTSTGLLNASCQVFGIVLTSAYSELLNKFGDIWADFTMSMLLFVGVVLIAVISSDLRRQAAQTKKVPNSIYFNYH